MSNNRIEFPRVTFIDRNKNVRDAQLGYDIPREVPEWAHAAFRKLSNEYWYVANKRPELIRHLQNKKVEYVVTDMDRDEFFREYYPDLQNLSAAAHGDAKFVIAESVSIGKRENTSFENKIIYFNKPFIKTKDDKTTIHEMMHMYDTELGFLERPEMFGRHHMPRWQNKPGRMTANNVFTLAYGIDLAKDTEKAVMKRDENGPAYQVYNAYVRSPNFEMHPGFGVEMLARAAEDNIEKQDAISGYLSPPATHAETYDRQVVNYDLSLDMPDANNAVEKRQALQHVMRHITLRDIAKSAIDNLDDYPDLSQAIDAADLYSRQLIDYLRICNKTSLDRRPGHPDNIPYTREETAAKITEAYNACQNSIARFWPHLGMIEQILDYGMHYVTNFVESHVDPKLPSQPNASESKSGPAR